MKVRIYLSEWFYNLGIIGFNEILQFNKENYDVDLSSYGYTIKDNYIEFDKELLREFHIYYFNYFIERYDVARELKKNLDFYTNLAKNEGKFKNAIDKIKKLIKDTNAKVLKIDDESAKYINELVKDLSKIKKPDELPKVLEIVDKFNEIVLLKKINSKMSLNKFKSILSNSFFGQKSYLNVINTLKSIEEQMKIMFNDYISPILYLKDLEASISENNEEQLNILINGALKEAKLNKTIEKLFKNINKKVLKKNKGISGTDEILSTYHTCSMCGTEKSLGNDYSEGDFVPLAISSDNAQNMFWNMNTTYPICDICRLILLCTPAGTVDIFKQYLDDKYDIKDKVYYGFINLDTKFSELIKINESFRSRNKKDSPYGELVLDIVQNLTHISDWQLSNILYVEFNTDYNSKNCKLNYLHIPRYLAEFLRDKSKLFEAIKDSKLKAEALDLIIGGKDLRHLIDRKLREVIQDKYKYTNNCLILCKIEYFIRRYKGGKEMASGSNDKRLKALYMQGYLIGEKFRNDKEENKITGIAYRLLNAAKAGNKSDFMDTVIRTHISCGEEVPMLFLDVMAEENLQFEEIAHSYITGLTSKSKNKDGEEKKNE